MIQCKECVGAACGTPPSCDIVVVVVLIASRSTSTQHVLQAATQDEYKLCVPITVLSALTVFSLYPPFHFPFILHLWSRTLEQRLPTLSQYHVASICSLIHLRLSFPLYTYLFNPYHWYLRGRLYDTDLIGSVHVFKSALLLVEEGIDSNQF